MRREILFSACCCLFAGLPAALASTYQLDDGSAELAAGLVSPGDYLFINEFQLSETSGVLSSVSVAFADVGLSGAAPIAPGDPFTVYVWSGTPDGEYELLAEVSATVDGAAQASGVFQHIPIEAQIPGELGAPFFVGVAVTLPHGGIVASVDTNGPADGLNSWRAATFTPGTLDPENLPAGPFGGLKQNAETSLGSSAWLLRADAGKPPFRAGPTSLGAGEKWLGGRP